MSFKIIDRTTDRRTFSDSFIKNHLKLGLQTWSEGADTTGINTLLRKDPVFADMDNRSYAALLSNDLNLMFNLDRTVFVSKKGVATGMSRNESSGLCLIKHFASILEAVQYLHGLTDATAPRIETYDGTKINLWSSNDPITIAPATIVVGPGTYIETGLFDYMMDNMVLVEIRGMGHVAITDNNIAQTAESSSNIKLSDLHIYSSVTIWDKLKCGIHWNNTYVDGVIAPNLSTWMSNIIKLYRGSMILRNGVVHFGNTKYGNYNESNTLVTTTTVQWENVTGTAGGLSVWRSTGVGGASVYEMSCLGDSLT